ncbi:MAG: RNA methyltransferase [Candidatus Xenobia bacterium]
MELTTAVVLVRPKHPGNVGSAARVVRNFAIDELVLVEPHASPEDEEARKLAYNSLNVLEAARSVPDLQAVSASYDICIGTSARRGRDRRTPMNPRRCMELLQKRYLPCRLALVFGPEEAGLTSEELELCQFTVEIPTNPEHPSMNLSHAVAVLVYELRMAMRKKVRTPVDRPHPRTQELLTVFEGFLQEVGYPTRTPLDRAVADVRRVLLAAPLTERDVKTALGLIRHLRHCASSPPADP